MILGREPTVLPQKPLCLTTIVSECLVRSRLISCRDTAIVSKKLISRLGTLHFGHRTALVVVPKCFVAAKLRFYLVVIPEGLVARRLRSLVDRIGCSLLVIVPECASYRISIEVFLTSIK